MKSRVAPSRLTVFGVLRRFQPTPPIAPSALEDGRGPSDSEGEESEESEYGQRGRQGEEDDGEMSDGSRDENGDGSMMASQPAIATAMERGAVVRAGEVSTAAIPDRCKNSLYAVLLRDTSVVVGLGGEVEGHGRRE